jgi:hypothetical protein
VSLVEIKISSVFLLDGDNFRQLDDCALHGVDALNDDEDLLPGPAGSGVPPDNGSSKHPLKTLYVTEIKRKKSLLPVTREIAASTSGATVACIINVLRS